MLHRASELDGLEQPRQQKMDMRLGTWNVKEVSIEQVH
jgi:hypothetical protein